MPPRCPNLCRSHTGALTSPPIRAYTQDCQEPQAPGWYLSPSDLSNREAGIGGCNIYQEERRQLIVDRARQDGRVESAALAVAMDVSLETVRRDLAALERQGLLRRTHGGALPLQKGPFDARLSARAQVMISEKRRIVKAALDLLPAEGSVLLDGGSTTVLLAELIPADSTLTIVTNALPIAATLATHRNITLRVVGGVCRERSQCFVGHWAVQNLREIRIDVGFLGTNGFTIERGLSTADEREAEVKHAMIEASRRVIVLTDHTKIGLDDFCRFGGLDDIDTLITDTGLDSDLEDDLRSSGLEVILV